MSSPRPRGEPFHKGPEWWIAANSDSPSSGEPPVAEPIKDSTGPRENAPDEGDLSNSDGEDDAPTIK